MKLKHFLFLYFGLIFSISWGNSQSLLEQANEAYKSENYTLAEQQYLEVLASGKTSWSLYYNLGNTYYRLSDMPRAILYYEKARKLNPNEKNIIDNIALAKNYIEDKSTTFSDSGVLSFFNAIIYAVHSNVWATLALISLAAMSVFFVLTYLVAGRSLKKALLLFAIFSCFLGFVFYLLAYVQKKEIEKPEAIIMESSVTITSEPKENSINLFILHEGSKVEIKETLNDWTKIQYDETKSGWMKSEFLEKI